MDGARHIRRTTVVGVGAVIALLTTLMAVIAPPPVGAADNFSPTSDLRWDVDTVDPNIRHTGPVRGLVWDLEEFNGRMYVAGKFLEVVAPDGSRRAQPYLAAFEVNTGEWIDSFRPQTGGAVYAIDITEDGRILAGGEIPGGIVSLDLTTGARAGNFDSQLTLNWAPPAVFDIEVSGNRTYVGGTFTGAQGTALRNLAKLNTTTGALDRSWLPVADLDTGTPRLGGRLVYGIAVDPSRERVYLAGKFGGINGNTNAAYFATLSTTNGLLRTDVPQGLPVNTLDHRESFSMWQHDVQFRGDRVYVGGQGHQTLILNATDLTPMQSFFTNRGVGNEFTGGDTQVLFIGRNTIWSGCHCWGSVGEYELGSYNAAPGGRQTYAEYQQWVRDFRDVDPFGQQAVSGGYGVDIATGELLPLDFNLGGQAGAYAIYEDSNNRLWLGGQFTRDPVTSRPIRGLARFPLLDAPPPPPPPPPPPGVAPAPAGFRTTLQTRERIVLNWQRVPDATSYEVFRDGTLTGTIPGVWFTDLGLASGASYNYTVRAVTAAGPGDLTAPLPVNTLPPADGLQPPQGLRSTLQTRERVVLNWQRVDGAVSYDILRNGTVVGNTSGVWFTDLGLPAGTSFSYTVRVRNAAGATSPPSGAVSTATNP